MFASPLAALKAVIQSQSAAAIPLPFTIATLANCTLWTIVGIWEMHDMYVYMPEVLGLLLGLCQIYLKWQYGDGPQSGSGIQYEEFHAPAPVEMPVPMLGKLRDVIMMGSSANTNNPQALLGSGHYMPLENQPMGQL